MEKVKVPRCSGKLIKLAPALELLIEHKKVMRGRAPWHYFRYRINNRGFSPWMLREELHKKLKEYDIQVVLTKKELN